MRTIITTFNKENFIMGKYLSITGLYCAALLYVSFGIYLLKMYSLSSGEYMVGQLTGVSYMAYFWVPAVLSVGTLLIGRTINAYVNGFDE
jgi:hypothetical protein